MNDRARTLFALVFLGLTGCQTGGVGPAMFSLPTYSESSDFATYRFPSGQYVRRLNTGSPGIYVYEFRDSDARLLGRFSDADSGYQGENAKIKWLEAEQLYKAHVNAAGPTSSATRRQ